MSDVMYNREAFEARTCTAQERTRAAERRRHRATATLSILSSRRGRMLARSKALRPPGSWCPRRG